MAILLNLVKKIRPKISHRVAIIVRIYIDFTYVLCHKKPLATEIRLSRIFRNGTIPREPWVFLKMVIMKFETVVYEKLIEIVRKNTSIYDSSTNEHKEFVLQNNIWRLIGSEMGIDALDSDGLTTGPLGPGSQAPELQGAPKFSKKMYRT